MIDQRNASFCAGHQFSEVHEDKKNKESTITNYHAQEFKMIRKGGIYAVVTMAGLGPPPPSSSSPYHIW